MVFVVLGGIPSRLEFDLSSSSSWNKMFSRNLVLLFLVCHDLFSGHCNRHRPEKDCSCAPQCQDLRGRRSYRVYCWGLLQDHPHLDGCKCDLFVPAVGWSGLHTEVEKQQRYRKIQLKVGLLGFKTLDQISDSLFDLKTMIPVDGMEVFNAALKITENIAYLLPKNTNVDQVFGLVFNTREKYF